MKVFIKRDLLHTLEQQVESQLTEMTGIFQNLKSEVLLKPSASGGWSMAQCFEHLNTYGHFYLPEIKKGIESQFKDSSVIYFKSTWLGNYFANLMEPKAGMKKMKAFKNHVPSVKLDAHAVIAEFIQQQEQLLKLIKLSENKDLNTIRISISISKFIKLRLGDVFRFIVAHNERHLQQGKRNL